MKKIFSCIIVLLIVAGCKREKVDYLGPAYVSAPDDFEIKSFSFSAASVNFETKNAFISGSFSSPVSWKLTIKGMYTGAIKEYSGISANIDSLKWFGAHDDLKFFRAGEKAVATVSFFGTAETASDTILITKVPKLRFCGAFFSKGEFEEPDDAIFGGGWDQFKEPNITYGIDSAIMDFKGNVVKAIQGRRFYYMKGLGAQANYVCGVSFNNTKNRNKPPISVTMPNIPSDPNNVWVNIYLYGEGDANAVAELKYQEDDPDDSTPGYQEESDDAYVARVPLTHTGWKLFSFKYSALKVSTDAKYGGSGNKKHEPHRLGTFVLVLVKETKPDSPVEVIFDYPIITVGHPFKPCDSK